MSLKVTGVDTSYSEVTSITELGFWLLVDDQEFFVPFAHYPAFRNATISQVYAVQRISPRQFYWPDLDIDIELEALEHPEKYPLVFR